MREPSRSDRPAAPESATFPSTDTKRRRFLFALGATGAGAAAAGAPLAAAVAPEAPAAEADTDARYRETGHVRDYYRTTRI
jgi:hypothetical protein